MAGISGFRGWRADDKRQIYQWAVEISKSRLSVLRPKFKHVCVAPSGLPLGRTLTQGYASTLTLGSRMPPLRGLISRHLPVRREKHGQNAPLGRHASV